MPWVLVRIWKASLLGAACSSSTPIPQIPLWKARICKEVHKEINLEGSKDPAVTPNNPKQTLSQSDLCASDGSVTVSLSFAISHQAVSSLWVESPRLVPHLLQM